MRKYILTLFLIVSAYISQAQQFELHLYGGHENANYLGCITCGYSHSKSVWNTNGIYGSKNGAFSIWNPMGMYGSDFGIYSAFNENATNPPVIKDNNGKIYGYFTLDRFKKGRFENSIVNVIYRDYKEIRENPTEWFLENVK